jgi:hypothetical protein
MGADDSERAVSAKEFREYADECLGWAKTAKSDKERKTFLQMAQAWLEAADLSETPPPAPNANLRLTIDQNKLLPRSAAFADLRCHSPILFSCRGIQVPSRDCHSS